MFPQKALRLLRAANAYSRYVAARRGLANKYFQRWRRRVYIPGTPPPYNQNYYIPGTPPYNKDY